MWVIVLSTFLRNLVWKSVYLVTLDRDVPCQPSWLYMTNDHKRKANPVRTMSTVESDQKFSKTMKYVILILVDISLPLTVEVF